MATATTFTHNNYVGEAYALTPQLTAFLSLAGQNSFARAGGVMTIRGPEFSIQTYTGESDAFDQVHLEGQDAPTETHVNPARVKNVVQIFHETVGVSTTAESSPDLVGVFSPAETRTMIGEGVPYRSKMNFQLMEKIKRVARQMNNACLNGTYAYPADNVTARKTRGMLAAVTTNDVAAAAAALSKTHVNAAVKLMVDNGGTFTQPYAFMGSFQKQAMSTLYESDKPRTRFEGGVRIERIFTDFGDLDLVYDRHMPADDILIADMAYVDPVWMIQSKGGTDLGLFIVKDLPETGLSYRKQLFGEFGLQHGPDTMHAKITNLATS